MTEYYNIKHVKSQQFVGDNFENYTRRYDAKAVNYYFWHALRFMEHSIYFTTTIDHIKKNLLDSNCKNNYISYLIIQ